MFFYVFVVGSEATTARLVDTLLAVLVALVIAFSLLRVVQTDMGTRRDHSILNSNISCLLKHFPGVNKGTARDMYVMVLTRFYDGVTVAACP